MKSCQLGVLVAITSQKWKMVIYLETERVCHAVPHNIRIIFEQNHKKSLMQGVCI
jgi:hypothetical protein